jgi:hypothetical protein
MNKMINQSINRLLLILALSTIAIFGCRCSTAKPDPLAGWRVSDDRDFNANKAIVDDYQSYIKTLSQEEQKSMAPVFCYENGTGQHAVLITIGINQTVWRHILIYDKDNKRIKTIKYASGDYHS